MEDLIVPSTGDKDKGQWAAYTNKKQILRDSTKSEICKTNTKHWLQDV